MTTEMHETVHSRAIEWHIRLRHGDHAEWEAFTAWLAQDESHLHAYESIESADNTIGPLLPELTFLEAANDGVDETPAVGRPARRWLWAGGALAASIAAVIIILPLMSSSRYDVATRPGETIAVSLDTQTRIVLNGATRMTFDRKDPRFALLDSGEALFQIRHDSARPFRLSVGDTYVEDAGTVFNVTRDGMEVRVAVADGRVVYDPEESAISLKAGQGLVDDGAGGPARIIDAPADTVGAWQRRQLIYRGEPLRQVAKDLSRALGISIAVSSTIADRPFHGTIAIDGTAPEQLERLKLTLDVDIETDSGGWELTPVKHGEQ